MWIWKPRTKKRDAYKVEMDRLLMMRMQLDPGTDAYDRINAEIRELQSQKTTNIKNGRKMTPEGRKTLGTVLAGVLLMGTNCLLEQKGGMLTGRRSKDADSIMSGVWRGVLGMFNRSVDS